MFIKEIKKKNKGYDKIFISHRLMESYRTAYGPRQRRIIDLGKLDIEKEQYKVLADRIEDILAKQSSCIPVDEHIEFLANHYACLIEKKAIAASVSLPSGYEPDYETVDINSVSNSRSRTISAEYVGLSMLKELGLDALLNSLGLSRDQINLSILSIVGRLVSPRSEKGTREWAQWISSLDELLGTDFSHLSNNALYRISDVLLGHKKEIEEHLRGRERDLFSLKENIILYDLTNTYFEGQSKRNKKARHGRSKDKRNDRPLITLGLIIDEMGFPKGSKIFKGNVSEPDTLIEMIEALQGEKVKEAGAEQSKKGITIVLDAGIAKEENLTLLKKEGYDYICVARNKPVKISEMNMDELLTIKATKDNKVEAQLIKGTGENILYCKSFLKAKKEEAMKNSFKKRFEEGMKTIQASLTKKGGVKKYDKVLERVGRLKERYSSIGQYYRIEVKEKDGRATAINWNFEKEKEAEDRFSGSYFLRTSLTDLTEKEIWSLYIMLTNVEDAFRSLKDELELRPVNHQKERRTDGHLFITTLAYHLLISIQTRLHRHGIYMRWWRIREFLSTQVRITTSMTNKEGKNIYIRNTSEAEWFHKAIYNALGLSYSPLPSKRVNEKICSPHKKMKI